MLTMFMLLSYLLPIFGLIVIGLVTVLKDKLQRVNILFFLLANTIALWLLALFVGDLVIDHTASLWAVRAATFVGTLIAPLLLYLADAFPIQLNKTSLKLKIFAVVPSLFFMALAFTPLLVPGILIEGHSAQPASLGLLYTLQSLYLIVSVVASFYIMIRKLRKVNSRERTQIKLFIGGLVVAVLVNIVTGVFLTLLGVADSFSNLAGAFSFLAFIGATSYAIVKYRLFDIRLAVTRVIGYSVTIGIVAGFYSLMILLLSTQMTSFGDINAQQLITLLLPTIFVALTFQRVERFVAKHTQRVFYRDAYDVREVLDSLSNALLAESDIENIMKQSLGILQIALKPRNSYLAVLNASGVIYKHVSFGSEHPIEIAELLDELSSEQRSLVDRGEKPNSSISKIMAKADTEILLRLGSQKNPVGLLILGGKQNGGMYTKQDVGVLQISAKNLGVALDNAKKYEQILHFADTMRKEVKHATAKLRHANEKLKTLDSLKDDFIATASHQLRTPAASVHDALRMLNHPSLNKKDRDELIQLAEASSEHLVTVVRTMLNMARLEAGHFTIDKSQSELVGLTERVIDQVKVLADQKGSVIQFTKPSHALAAQVDTAKINEALANYIENAVKYSPINSKIGVSLAEIDGKFVFEVTDQGMGVPDEERKNLFGKFYRAANARQEQPDGNGIGLYVVKSIATGHGGDTYYRPGETRGSVFGFWLPSSEPITRLDFSPTTKPKE